MEQNTTHEPVGSSAWLAASGAPYYQRHGITLYCADSRAVNFGDGTVITDPPFNIGYHYDGYGDTLPDAEYCELLKSLIPASEKPCVVVHYPEWICRLSMISGKAPERIVQWVYPSNTRRQHRSIGFWNIKPDFSRGGQPYKNPNDKRVAALIAQGREAKLYDWWEINQVKNVGKDKTAHPCQMPVEVMRRIIKVADPKRIIEPFAGSGSTLAAAMMEGIPCIAAERNEAYCEIIAKRLDALAANKPELSDGAKSKEVPNA